MNDTQTNYGAWSLKLRSQAGRDEQGKPLAAAPQEILDLFAVTDGPDAFLGHVIVTSQAFDPEEVDVLSLSRYTGVLRESKFTSTDVEIAGSGLVYWLGDLQERGPIFDTELSLSGVSFTDGITAILPPAIVPGNIVPEIGSASANYLFVTARAALEDWLSLFDAEYYVTPQGELNAGTPAALFDSYNNPTTFVIRKGSGDDPNFKPLPLGSATFSGDMTNFATKVISLVQVEETNFIEGGAEESTSKRDLHGNLVSITAINNEVSTLAQNVDARAAARLAQLGVPRTSLELSTENYDIHGDFIPGDSIWVYDVPSGLYDLSNEIEFKGQIYWPIKLRVLEITYPVVKGMGVYFKTPSVNPITYDLTPYIDWEPPGTSQIVVGAFTRSLIPPSSGGIGGIVAPIVNPGAPPGIPDPPSVFGDERTLFVVVPTTSAGQPQPSNVTTMRVYASTTSGFTPGPTNYIGAIPVSKANITLGQNVRGAFEWFVPDLTYVRVTAVNTVEGPASIEVSDAATLIPSAAILSLIADKIDAGTISASVELTAALITGGEINGGIFRTALTGRRVVIDGISGTSHQVQLFSGETVLTEFPGVLGANIDGAGGTRRPRTFLESAFLDTVGADAVQMNLRGSSADETLVPEFELEVGGGATFLINEATGLDLSLGATTTMTLSDTGGLDLVLGANTTMTLNESAGLSIGVVDGYVSFAAAGIDLAHDLGGRIFVDEQIQLIANGVITMTIGDGEVGVIGSSSFSFDVIGLGTRRLYIGVPDSGGTGRRLVYMDN